MRNASWIIRNRHTKAVVCETFNPRLVQALNTLTYEAVPIMVYLGELNRSIFKAHGLEKAIKTSI